VAESVNVFVIKDQILTIVAIVLPHILGEEHHPEDDNDQLGIYLLNFSKSKN
jgi:hypothetical protein